MLTLSIYLIPSISLTLYLSYTHTLSPTQREHNRTKKNLMQREFIMIFLCFSLSLCHTHTHTHNPSNTPTLPTSLPISLSHPTPHPAIIPHSPTPHPFPQAQLEAQLVLDGENAADALLTASMCGVSAKDLGDLSSVTSQDVQQAGKY